MARAPKIDTGAAKAFGKGQKVGINTNIIGLKELQAKLRGMPEKMVKKVMRSALRNATKIVLAQMKNKVPVEEGELKSTLVAKSAKRSRRNKNIISQRAMTDPSRLEAIGLFNPHWIEYGAPGHTYFGHGKSPLPPRPFARPAADASRQLANQFFITGVRAAVTEMCREPA
jgi:HK97 gp10 family phage protein